jgi:acyl transferase domain-containing protein/acyl carrier protein/predicted O-methyltransferase YrrM
VQDFLSRISNFSQKRLALLADELQRRVEALEAAQHAPVAIVGIGCRFPGGVDTPERFWDLLQGGVDAITEVPAERWNIADYYHPDPDTPGKMSSRHGGFVGDVSGFDTHFFGIAPREAQHLDPQHRLLLEVAWEALEHAGIRADHLKTTQTGVFVGLSAIDYLQLLRDRGLPSFDAYTASGSAHSMASGRLSYFLGTQGPSLSIDTACSSSLVAIHQAVQSLRRRESDLALAGGVNLLLRPDVTVALSRAHMMAPDGRCKVFDRRADGFVRSEGCGIVVLKRLADAQAAGDRVIAVIRGSASNQDGRSNGLTAPNGAAQERVLQAALADARLAASQVQFVETHGTGTSLGDPIEVNALAAVYGRERDQAQRLLIGSVKANIGHLEAAAGVAALIKAALAIQHQSIPRQIHFSDPNPFIPWAEIPLDVPTATTNWPADADGRRVAGVSSFGFSGTNVHVLLSSAPPVQQPTAVVERPLHVVTVSAGSDAARRTLATRYAAVLRDPSHSLADVAYSANTGRAALAHRLAVVAATSEEAAAKLNAAASGELSATVMAGSVPPRAPRIAFLFTGQGSQYAGMGSTLYRTQQVFREALDECDALLRPLLGQSLVALLYPGNGTPATLEGTEYAQPALFAVEYALAVLWQHWGVRPAALLGHSLGEYVAATVGGMLTLGDALAMIAVRGRIMSALPRNGAMAAVIADEMTVREMIAPWRREVVIAAVNGPAHIVISGPEAAVAAVTERATIAGIDCLRLAVSHAFHSPLMVPIQSELESACRAATYHPAEIDVISNVTGQRFASGEMNAAYWSRQVTAPVQFARGIETLAAMGCDTFIEIGPQPTLIGMARQSLQNAGTFLPSLRRGGNDWAPLLESVATLHVRGASIDWASFDAGYSRRKVVLPRYPFQRERYWAEPIAQPVPVAEAPPALPARVAELMHEVVWREAPAAGTTLLSPAALRALVEPRVPAVARDAHLHAYEPFKTALDRLTSLFIVAALKQLGADLPVGSTFTAQALADRLGVTGRHHRLFARLLAILAEDGYLEGVGAGWRVLMPLESDDPDAESERLLRQHPAGAAELVVTARCARELAPVLREQIDPLTLLFPDGSLADMERLYRTSAPATVYNRLIAETLTAIERGWSGDRPLRILELGAGTGSTTSYVLGALQSAVDYTFTDVSPLFLQRARTAFGNRPGMHFALLDISTDPAAQGLTPGSFDVIIGANVLHATPDLAVSLGHTRSLLAPGGLLVLLEATAPQRFGDVTVGLLDGWWAYTDLDRRDYALMPRERWRAVLDDAGFAQQAVIVDAGAGAGPVLDQQAIFVAQLPASVVARSSERWLIVADRGGMAERVASELRARGDVASVILPGAAALTLGLDAAQRRSEPIGGVVHLACLDVTLDDTTTADAMWADQEQMVRAALETVQTLIAKASAAPVRLWFVTRGGQATAAADHVNAAQAPLWGLAHVVALEHPELQCRRVDLDPAIGPTDGVTGLVDELQGQTTEDQVSFRGPHRLVRRLAAHQPRPASLPLTIEREATYLVTGGARGLGQLTAEWLVARGARSLVLMSRRPADAEVERRRRSLEASGATVKVVSGDVAREDDVRRVLDDIAATMPPLRGIVHAAGVLDDGALLRQDWSRFATVMAPKVLGTWHLHRLAGRLDFFAIYSSGAAIAGSPGQANHAAANAFEDAFAWYRASQGQPTVSINWGAWAEIGAAADRAMSSTGFLRKIAPADGLIALGEALRAPDHESRLPFTQLVVLAADWSALADAPPVWSAAPLFREIRREAAQRTASGATTETAAPTPTLRETLQTVAANRRATILQEHVRLLTVRVLGIPPEDTFDVAEPLRQLGLDSLMAVELRNVLAKAAGVALPATITFDYPSVAALTAYLADAAFNDLMPAPSVADALSHRPAPAVAPEAEVDREEAATTEELAAQLARSLDRLFLEDPQ